MPVRTATTAPVATPSSAGGARPLGSLAFKNDPQLAKIAAGAAPPIARGAPKSTTVQNLQAALYSLGFIKPRGGIDGAFGPNTEKALKEFQASKGLAQSGTLDANTLKALDKAASAQIATLKGQSQPDGKKAEAYRVVADISDPKTTRLYVLDQNDEVVSRYLTSPGTAQYPTRGDHFKVTDVLPRKAWNPPNSGWARGAKPIPPGLDNPMGILKLSLGAYAQYIHGIPVSEEKDLGHAASHGCMRMSGSNILELGEKYAGAGTDVTINRDKNLSKKLAAAYTEAGIEDRPTDAGREYMFGYVSGELGTQSRYTGPVG
jgi:peptidoglycan hydrolase-like protein with peptidoglycan-binding domain